jgi:hypothetical protein
VRPEHPDESIRQEKFALFARPSGIPDQRPYAAGPESLTMHSSRQFVISSHTRPANGAAATLRNMAAVAVLVALPLMAASAAAQYGGPHNQLRYDEVQDYSQTQYQPQYNDSAARQTPRIAQPQALTPVRTYAPAPYPTTGAAIIQPDYLTPAKESPTVAKAASEPPAAAPAPAGPNNSVAAKPPAVKKPVERSGFWQLVLGPSDTNSTKNQAAPAAPQRTHYSAVQPPAPAAAGSLWSQFLGHNAAPQQLQAQPQTQRQPQPRVTSAPPAPAIKANPLQLAAAEESNTWWPYPPPTVKDVQDAKTPAVSATITVSGGLPPANAQSTTAAAQPAPTGAPNSQGIPTVPSVPGMTHSEMSSAAYGLFQPFQMTNDAPVAAMPVGENVRKTAESNRKQKSEADSVPSLLQPFYATNDSPSSSRRSRGSSNATDKSPESITDALIASPLGRQLSMQSDEDLRTSGLASIEADVKSEKPWDGTVTVTWPLMANPFVMPENIDAPVAVQSNVAQVAFMQDSLPSPGGSSNSNEDDDKSADGEKKDDKDTLVGSETLGNAPEDNTLAFLRTQTVLLAPGKHQFDIGIEYTITENDFPILREADGGGVFVDNVEFKARELAVPMELRYGLLPRLQGFLQVPVGWSNVQAAFDNYDEYENDGGLGDIGFGLTAQLRDAFKDCPYIIGTLAGLAPTGGDPFGVVGQITPNAPSLGNGFWAISGNLLWVQTRYDPVVVYYGLGARYQFEREYFDIEFQPGMEYNYTLGAGFAVNERCTLSTQFFGAFIEELKANGERVEGTIQEPLNLRVAATLAKPCNRLVEPFCTFGLTDDAISSNIGITWTY